MRDCRSLFNFMSPFSREMCTVEKLESSLSTAVVSREPVRFGDAMGNQTPHRSAHLMVASIRSTSGDRIRYHAQYFEHEVGTVEGSMSGGIQGGRDFAYIAPD
jgi:hypothetical protein